MIHYALMTEEEITEAIDILYKAIEREKKFRYVERNQVIEDMERDLEKLQAVWRVI